MTILLTGATGFLGSRLCAALLRRTDREIVCVVRAGDARQAEERVRGLLRAQDPAVAASRALRCVPGDLTGDDLGVGGPAYEDLLRSVEEVYHCGASVNMAAPYEHLAPVNVGATARVVEFCRSGRGKRLHHVSTLGVFLAGRASGRAAVHERTAPSAQTCGRIGYPRSKFDAESLVAEAAAAGLPVTVYRPGLVLADSRSGASPDDDFVARLYAASVLTGSHPRCLSSIPVMPVDCAAEVIAELSLRPDERSGPYHVMLPQPLPATELFDWARSFGYALAEVSPGEWRAALKAHSRSRAALAMRVLAIADHILGLSENSRLPDYRCDAVTDTLRRLHWQDRLLGPDYFAPMFRSLIDRHVLPPVHQP
jgi:thioester reductase-like protein